MFYYTRLITLVLTTSVGGRNTSTGWETLHQVLWTHWKTPYLLLPASSAVSARKELAPVGSNSDNTTICTTVQAAPTRKFYTDESTQCHTEQWVCHSTLQAGLCQKYTLHSAKNRNPSIPFTSLPHTCQRTDRLPRTKTNRHSRKCTATNSNQTLNAEIHHRQYYFSRLLDRCGSKRRGGWRQHTIRWKIWIGILRIGPYESYALQRVSITLVPWDSFSV